MSTTSLRCGDERQVAIEDRATPLDALRAAAHRAPEQGAWRDGLIQELFPFYWPEAVVTQRLTASDENARLSQDEAPYWMNYRQAALYTGWSIPYLRNLVSADAIPHYGKPRSRRFRRDMLDLFLTDRDAAMRKFRAEREAQRGY